MAILCHKHSLNELLLKFKSYIFSICFSPTTFFNNIPEDITYYLNVTYLKKAKDANCFPQVPIIFTRELYD